MSETPTGSIAEDVSAVPDFPMPRAAGCPFAPPPLVLERGATKQLFRVRIWDGSTPWLITGYEAIRSLFADGRASVDDRKPGYPHWNEGNISPRCISGRDRCSPRMQRNTPDFAGCCPGRSRSNASRRCGPLCSASPTRTSTRSSPGRNRPTWSRVWPWPSLAGDQRNARRAIRRRRFFSGIGQ